MKQFEPVQNIQESIKIVNEKQVDYEKKFLGTTKRYNGHIMFEINCSTGKIQEATFKEEKIVLVPNVDLLTGAVVGTNPVTVRDIDCKENCLYIAALNKKNALRKFIEYVRQNAQNNI